MQLILCRRCQHWSAAPLEYKILVRKYTFRGVVVQLHEQNNGCRHCDVLRRQPNIWDTYYLAAYAAVLEKLRDSALPIYISKKDLRVLGKVRNVQRGRPSLYWYKLSRKLERWLAKHLPAMEL